MYRVKLTPAAYRMFNSLHSTVKKQLKSILKELYENLYLGKELRGELTNFRSLKMNATEQYIELITGIKRQLYMRLDTEGIFMR